MLWEASDRVCGKRLRPLLPILLEAIERHGHMQPAADVKASLLAMSAATIDRALEAVRVRWPGLFEQIRRRDKWTLPLLGCGRDWRRRGEVRLVRGLPVKARVRASGIIKGQIFGDRSARL